RIPFPLLRQTAWLLTVATIAFNGAAAWPDPLGVGMHAVIPILFVVSVEAARHAIGRIADITADKHMEGVRPTRWLLSPLPTFLLWRRMKLWELRSYEQVIKLEQERLVYQARLRSRFGRAWRRKAPVESLMPLRLARYGVPLADTAPADLAGAATKSPLFPPSTPSREVEVPPSPRPNPLQPLLAGHFPLPQPGQPQPQLQHHAPNDQNSHFKVLDHKAVHGSGYDPTYDEPKHHISRGAERIQGREEEPSAEQSPAGQTATTPSATAPPAPASATARATAADPSPAAGPTTQSHPRPAGTTQVPDETTSPQHGLSPVDRYFLAWQDFQHQHKKEPTPAELSSHLARQGVLDRANQPLKAKTLTRYFLQFRIYAAWAEQRAVDDHPPLDHIAKELARRGITAQYNQPIDTHDLEKHHDRFERRWQALRQRHPDAGA
ncbi:DUF2637 domain-containing protein, partial [Streptomyces sp. NPDC005574]|uniref:DUF2637 domain-containing protein n=1 Tax=Streptomyces sp. NPDC005574 TaxID=3156891 RepID=UPI0033AF3DF5